MSSVDELLGNTRTEPILKRHIYSFKHLLINALDVGEKVHPLEQTTVGFHPIDKNSCNV